MNNRPIVIIGTGLAGYMLAKELRKLDTTTPLVMITMSDGTFYSKPLLSTSLSAKREISAIATADVASMANSLNADIRVATSVTRINTQDKIIETVTENIPYEKLILATGSTVIRPPLLGNAVDNILSVNDLEDYARFCEVIVGKKSIAILGAGLVGCEFANDLSNTQHQVHVIDPAYYPLQRLLPEKIGRVLERSLAANGVNWHFGKLVSEINHNNNKYELTLSHQDKLSVDVVMSAIGLRPNIEMAQNAGIKSNYGILVDNYLKTNVPDVYALGDCAEVSGVVLFFVAPLMQCARALAKTITGMATEVVYPIMPVVLKTPACPIVIASPPRQLLGDWEVVGSDDDLRALYFDKSKKLSGFVLSGKMVAEKNKLVAEISASQEIK